MVVLLGGAYAKEGDQVFPYSLPCEDLKHWSISGNPSCLVRGVQTRDGLFPKAIEFDARMMFHGEAFAISEVFPVAPMKSYYLGAMVKRIRGGGYRYEVAVQWLDQNTNMLWKANTWNGVFLGRDWQLHQARVISPKTARHARLIIGLGQNLGTEEHVAWFTKLELRELATSGPDLAIELMPEPASPQPGGQPASLNVRIENRGDQAVESLAINLKLPKGMSSSETFQAYAGTLSYGEAYARTIPLRGSPEDPDGLIDCEVTARAAGELRTYQRSTKPFISIASQAATATPELKPPVRPPMKLKLGCWYMPSMMDWDHQPKGKGGMRRVDYLKPLLGYYDEARPDVADWHIRWAAAHGIAYLVFNWYWNKGMDFLNDALDRGFLHSRFAGQMEFSVHWCNEETCMEFQARDYSDATLEKFIRTLCQRYFTKTNYLRVDGKPVVFIFMPAKIANARGGWEGCRKGLDLMRSVARSYGHPGVYFVAGHHNPYILDYGQGGFDCATAYTFMYCDVPLKADRSTPYEALLPAYREGMAVARRRAREGGIAYIPSAWAGWDDYGRAGENSTRTRGNTPAAFRRMIETLPDYVEEDTKLALIEAWNEWGEGTRIEPGEPHGFAYLSAVRDILSGTRGPYRVPVPPSQDIRDVQTSLTLGEIFDDYRERFARQLNLRKGVCMDFKSPDSLWMRSDFDGDLRCVRIEAGALRGQSIGRQPVLLGPPFMGLDAAGVKAIRIRMSATKGSEGSFYWSTEARKEWSNECSLHFSVLPDDQMHDYVLAVGKNPYWAGTVRQFRLIPANGPGPIAIERIETVADSAH